MIVDMWLRACAFDIVLPQHTHSHVQKHVKMARNISDEIDLDKELKVFLLEGSKSDVWEYLVSLPQVENAQNLYPNFSFTIVVIQNFTIAQLQCTIHTVHVHTCTVDVFMYMYMYMCMQYM